MLKQTNLDTKDIKDQFNSAYLDLLIQKRFEMYNQSATISKDRVSQIWKDMRNIVFKGKYNNYICERFYIYSHARPTLDKEYYNVNYSDFIALFFDHDNKKCLAVFVPEHEYHEWFLNRHN